MRTIYPEIREVTETVFYKTPLPDLQSFFNMKVKQEGLTAKWFYRFDPFWGPEYYCEVLHPNRIGGMNSFRMNFRQQDFDYGDMSKLGLRIFENFQNCHNKSKDEHKMPGLDHIE